MKMKVVSFNKVLKENLTRMHKTTQCNNCAVTISLNLKSFVIHYTVCIA